VVVASAGPPPTGSRRTPFSLPRETNLVFSGMPLTLLSFLVFIDYLTQE
jgi:hypothetical protein